MTISPFADSLLFIILNVKFQNSGTKIRRFSDMTKLFTDFQDLRMDYIYAEEVWTHQDTLLGSLAAGPRARVRA